MLFCSFSSNISFRFFFSHFYFFLEPKNKPSRPRANKSETCEDNKLLPNPCFVSITAVLELLRATNEVFLFWRFGLWFGGHLQEALEGLRKSILSWYKESLWLQQNMMSCQGGGGRLISNFIWQGGGYFQRGTMFRWTLKLKEVLNKQILSASVPEAAVLIWNSHSLE